MGALKPLRSRIEPVHLVVLLLTYFPGALAQSQEPPATFEEAAKRLSSAPADACEQPWRDFSDLEFRLFMNAAKMVVQELNDDPMANSAFLGLGARTRAIEALKRLERLSAEINRIWPDDRRFHFEVVDLPPAIVVKMTYRNRATFSFLSKFQDRADQKVGERWQFVGALDDHSVAPSGAGHDDLDLVPLSQSPSGKPRFLARFRFVVCGSGVGMAYYAYQWDPQTVEQLEEIIQLEGDVSQFDTGDGRKEAHKDKEDEFLPVGEFQANCTPSRDALQ